MAPPAYITHHTTHRLRIKIPSQKGDGDYFSRLRAFFVQKVGVERVEVNPLTGSLLIVTREELRHPLDIVGSSQWFELRENGSDVQPLTQQMVQGFRALDVHVEKFTGGELDIASVAVIGLVIAGIYQVSIGNFAAPAWYTAFWYATSIAMKSDRPTRSGYLM